MVDIINTGNKTQFERMMIYGDLFIYLAWKQIINIYWVLVSIEAILYIVKFNYCTYKTEKYPVRKCKQYA